MRRATEVLRSVLEAPGLALAVGLAVGPNAAQRLCEASRGHGGAMVACMKMLRKKVPADIYVVGGKNDASVALVTVERYSPASNEWRAVPPMRVARYGCAAASLGGRLYVAGGHDGKQVQSLGVLAADAQRPLPGHGRGRPRPALCRRRPRQPGDGFAGADAGGRGELRPTARPMGGAAFAALGTLGLLCVGGTGADLRRGREPREGDGSAEARLAGFLLDLGARGPEAEVWLCRCSSFRHHLRHGGPRRRAPRFLFRALRPSGRWRRWRRWRRWQG
mmetsp:Transcript_164804/g.528767  ORF Transcript_164804/g.528767 Transcript_164804/m.528767 type:complete len:277 (-) Transcript_164804:244-1074(-)